MNWKFWQKRGNQDAPKNKIVKLPKPKELPDQVGIYLVTQLHEDPDWVWNLRYVSRPKEEEKHILEFKIFNPLEANQKGCSITDYYSLDIYPDLTIFSGFFDKKSGTVSISKRLKDVA
jgi:hypothetical protein